jgi:hypothetical protein
MASGWVQQHALEGCVVSLQASRKQLRLLQKSGIPIRQHMFALKASAQMKNQPGPRGLSFLAEPMGSLSKIHLMHAMQSHVAMRRS